MAEICPLRFMASRPGARSWEASFCSYGFAANRELALLLAYSTEKAQWHSPLRQQRMVASESFVIESAVVAWNNREKRPWHLLQSAGTTLPALPTPSTNSSAKRLKVL